MGTKRRTKKGMRTKRPLKRATRRRIQRKRAAIKHEHPRCLVELGCICAGHMRNPDPTTPCDAVERDVPPPHNDPEAGGDATCCTVCGGMNVQYAVWYRPNGGHQDFEMFCSWNAGDNTFCWDCEVNGRDPNPPLVCADADREEYLNARSLRLGDGRGRGKTFIPPKFNSEGERIDEHGNPIPEDDDHA